MSWLRTFWLRLQIRSAEMEVDELQGHIQQFIAMVAHKRKRLVSLREQLCSIEMDRP